MHHAAFDGNLFRVLHVSKVLSDNIQTIVVMPDDDEKPARFLHEEGIMVYQIPFQFPLNVKNPWVHMRWFMMLFPSIFCLMAIVRKERVEIIHVNGMLNIQGFITGMLTRTKIVLHLNDINTPRVFVKFLMPLTKVLADSIAVSANNVGKYYSVELNSKTITLYPPVDPYRFDPQRILLSEKIALKHELKIDDDQKIIGTVGSINPSKGLEYFIVSASKVKEKHCDVKFIIVGPELKTRKEYNTQIKNLIKNLGLKQDVLLTGLRSDIPELLSIFDIFVLSSTHEACPIAVLEAMAMEKPVVATDVGGVPEQIINNKTGILVPSRDSLRLGEAINDLLESPKSAEQLGREARKRVITLFSLERCARTHREIYENLEMRV